MYDLELQLENTVQKYNKEIQLKNTVEKKQLKIQLTNTVEKKRKLSCVLFCICLISDVDKVVGGPASHWEGEYQDGERRVDVSEKIL